MKERHGIADSSLQVVHRGLTPFRKGEAYAAVEAPERRVWHAIIVSDGANKPYRLKIRAPGFAHLSAMRRDGTRRPHARGRGRGHWYAGYRVRRDRSGDALAGKGDRDQAKTHPRAHVTGGGGGDSRRDHTCEEIDRWRAKYPEGSPALGGASAALHAAQHQNDGYLTRELMEAVAEKLELPAIQVFEVGERSTRCSRPEARGPAQRVGLYEHLVHAVRLGRADTSAHIEKKLGIKAGESYEPMASIYLKRRGRVSRGLQRGADDDGRSRVPREPDAGARRRNPGRDWTDDAMSKYKSNLSVPADARPRQVRRRRGRSRFVPQACGGYESCEAEDPRGEDVHARSGHHRRSSRRSGLRGRGGAGFPDRAQVEFHAPKDFDRQKYAVCNSDESEPGTCQRSRHPALQPALALIEGMAIGELRDGRHRRPTTTFAASSWTSRSRASKRHSDEAYAAATAGQEHPGLRDRLRSVTAILGAGAYICGEETAHCSSLSKASPGVPRFKPPFPAELRCLRRSRPPINNTQRRIASVPADHSQGRGLVFAEPRGPERFGRHADASRCRGT